MASASGDWSQVENYFCWDQSSDINWAPTFHAEPTVLTLVLQSQQWDLAARMLANDRKPSSESKFAFYKAVYSKDWDKLAQLIPQQKTPFNWDVILPATALSPRASFLWWAAYKDQPQLVRLMLANNPNANIDAMPPKYTSLHGCSVLWITARRKHWDIVAYMLTLNPYANVNTRYNCSWHFEEEKAVTVATFAARAGKWDIILQLLSLDAQLHCGISNSAQKHKDIELRDTIWRIRDLLVFVASLAWTDHDNFLSHVNGDLRRLITLHLLRSDEGLPMLAHVTDDLLMSAVNSAEIRTLAIKECIERHPASKPLSNQAKKRICDVAESTDVNPLLSGLGAIHRLPLSKPTKWRRANDAINKFVSETKKRPLEDQNPPAKRQVGDQFFGEVYGRFFALVRHDNHDPTANDPILARLRLTREDAIYRMEALLESDLDNLIDQLRWEVLMAARIGRLGSLKADNQGQLTRQEIQNYYQQVLGHRENFLTPYLETEGLLGALVRHCRIRLVIWGFTDDATMLRPLHVYGSEFESTVHLLMGEGQVVELAERPDLAPVVEDLMPSPEGPASMLSSSSALFKSM